nr:PREDICTED: uncharacterized protein LOC108193206 [Daucus carota subsp. sativus]
MSFHLRLDKSLFSQLTCNKDKDAHQSVIVRALEMIFLSRIGLIQSISFYIPPNLDQCPVARWKDHIFNPRIRWLGLCNLRNKAYEIPSCFFDCVGLTSLQLHTWILNSPYKSTRFANLVRVRLGYVKFTADISFGTRLRSLVLEHCTGIQHLACQFTSENRLIDVRVTGSEQLDWRWFECTSLLEILILKYSYSPNYKPKKPFNMTKFIGNLPRIYAFCTNGFALQVCRPVLTMINGRATKFDNLKELGLCPLGSYNLCQISNAIYLIRCFPSLRRFLAILVDDKRANPPDLASNLDSVDLKDTSLCQLHTVDVLGVTASNYVFHLVKLLLASAPSLKVMSLHCSGEVTDPGERLKIKQELQRFPKCSSGAQILLLGFESK